MYANGFLAEKRRSPISLVAVIGLHASALGAVLLYGTTTFLRQEENRLVMVDIKPPPPPPVNPPPPPRTEPQASLQPTVAPTIVQPVTPTITAPVTQPVINQQPVIQTRPIEIAAVVRPVIPEPVRRGAEVDSRYRDALQPPYPSDRIRAEQEGRVRVRITIGPDGRVSAIEQISSTHDSFWRVTERQALTRWRFRPATVDGRPVVSTMMFTVTFRLPEA